MGCSNGSTAQAAFHKQYVLCAKLGSGSFGQVWEIRPKISNEPVDKLAKPLQPAGMSALQETHAAKICDLREEVNGDLYISKKLILDAQHELYIWRLLGSHENCVQLFQSFMEDHLCYMIMEKCECSILNKFENMLDVTEGDLSTCIRQMLQGILHLHSVRIVHLDVKPENFLFSDRTFTTVKLCDFGLAKRLPRLRRLYGRCGTVPYMSPEMVADIGYVEKTDVWSCGATVYLLLYGDLPYIVPGAFDREKIIEAIRVGSPPIPFARNPELHLPPPSACAIEFSKALLQRLPSVRCSAKEALELPFLSETAMLECEPPISPVMKCARNHTMKFKQPIDYIKQRTLDEILSMLQEEYAGTDLIKRSFSEPIYVSGDENFDQNSNFEKQVTGESQRSQRSQRSQKLPLIERVRSRHSTHSGTVSWSSSKSHNLGTQSEQSHGSGTSSLKMSL